MRSFGYCLKFLILFLALGFGASEAAHASGVIREIRVEGNKRIDKETIITRQKLRPGESYTPQLLNDSLKALYATEWFEHVGEEVVENNVLLINVKENPTVNQVSFEGNSEVSDEILKSETKLKPLEVYTTTRVKNDTKRVQDIYRLKGHFAAIVTPKVIKREQNRVDVVFEIKEGTPTKISKIFFIGNKKFSESKLESMIQTKESRWYRFFSSDDTYDADRLAYDRELLRRFYLEHGYADFRVKSSIAELTPDQKEFFITFTVEEGERYQFGKLDISSEVKDVDPSSLKDLIKLKEGDWYNSKEVEKVVNRLTDALGNKGYAFVDVNPKIAKDSKDHKVNITFVVQEGPRVYINQIKILGNTRTDDDVIRREIRLYEGDAFNTNKLKESERRIKDLGYFKDVKVKREPTMTPDKMDIIIEVEEDRTGELSLGAGFSTTDGPLVDTRFTERNFRGRGQGLGVSLTVAKRRNDFEINFMEPYFLGRELAAGFDLFRTSQKSYLNASYDQTMYGITLKVGYRITENTTQQVYYTIRQDQISNVNATASRFVQEQKGRSVLSILGHTVVYDQTDSRIDPTDGYRLGFGNDFAGLGGNITYLKSRIFGSYFYPVADDWVFSLSGSTGVMTGLGKKVRVADRYSLGGDTLRGFEFAGVGPRDKNTLDMLGGLRYYNATAELVFPVGLPNEFGVKGALFTDMGSAWYTGDNEVNVVDAKSLRASAGFGIHWKSPMGPLKVYLGFPLKKDKLDKTQLVNFGFSTRF